MAPPRRRHLFPAALERLTDAGSGWPFAIMMIGYPMPGLGVPGFQCSVTKAELHGESALSPRSRQGQGGIPSVGRTG